MRLTRVHVAMPLAVGTQLALPESAAAHLIRVLRLRQGDECVLFNGDGHDYRARLISADRRRGVVEVREAEQVCTESPLRLLLVQGIARGEKMDWILQKATELGVAGIAPVSSERSEVRLDAARADKRLAHWHSVVVSACEQSGRAQVPDVASPQPLDHALAALPAATTRLLLDPTATHSLSQLPAPDQTRDSPAVLVLAVGPEGGWSARDHQQLVAAGFTGIRAGPRILRTETAGIAVIAALQARFGDLG